MSTVSNTSTVLMFSVGSRAPRKPILSIDKCPILGVRNCQWLDGSRFVQTLLRNVLFDKFRFVALLKGFCSLHFNDIFSTSDTALPMKLSVTTLVKVQMQMHWYFSYVFLQLVFKRMVETYGSSFTQVLPCIFTVHIYYPAYILITVNGTWGHFHFEQSVCELGPCSE